MKSQVPVAITTVVGLVIILEFFFPMPGLTSLSKQVQAWGIVVAAFALGLAAINLARVHVARVRAKRSEWYNSAALLIVLVVQTVIGLSKGITSTEYKFGFDYIQTPLGATIFALLAFYIASAGYRAFITKTFDSTLLLIAAVVVMLGAVPVGEIISKQIPVLSTWIKSFPNMAAQRGIIIGSALGAIALGLRILLGIDRGHLGGGAE